MKNQNKTKANKESMVSIETFINYMNYQQSQ